MIHVYFTHLTAPLPTTCWDHHFDLMPLSLQSKIMRFRRWQDRHAALLGKVLLRQGLMRFGYDTSCLQHLTYTRFNRPYIEAGIDFNISHSGGYVVCAISDVGRVGIDVERIRPIETTTFKNYMTEQQWQAITTSPSPAHTFFEIWTIKESVIKVDGRGLSLPLETIEIVEQTARVCNQTWFLQDVQLDSAFYCHLATDLPKFELQMIPFAARQ